MARLLQLRTDYAAFHEIGMTALRARNLRAMERIIHAERAILEEQRRIISVLAELFESRRAGSEGVGLRAAKW